MRYIGGKFELGKLGLLALPVAKNKVVIYSEIDRFEECSREYFISEYVYRDGRTIDKIDLDSSKSKLAVMKKNKTLVIASFDTEKKVWLVKYNKRIREFKSGMFYFCFEPYREEGNSCILHKYMTEDYKIKCKYMSRAGAFETVWSMEMETDRYAYYEGNLRLIMIPRDVKPLTIKEYAEEIAEWTEQSGIQKVLGYTLMEKATGKIVMEF